jgi:hypothetical protein
MSEERMQILKMLEAGQINAKEAADLLHALEKPKAPPDMPPTRGRWMRVRVTDVASGRVKVSVNVPMSLVDVGIRMGARFMPKTESVDPQQILEALRGGETGKIIDVEDSDSGEHVEIYVD